MKIDAIKEAEIIHKPNSSLLKPEDGKTEDFGKLLSQALNNVNQLQKDAEMKSVDFAANRLQDISQVTIATEKAAIALQLTMQVRNKVVDAYQEVMRMQV